MNPHPIRAGVLLATAAAVLFGVSAPVIAKASAGSGNLPAGALLYLGAALACVLALLARKRDTTRDLPRAALVVLPAVALFGAVLAPAALVLGLRRVDPATTSLLLALEAPFTLALARLFYREHLGGRVVAAAALILAGGALLALQEGMTPASMLGLGLVVLSAAAWAMDNTLSRRLADLDPVAVVAGKGLLGALASSVTAWVLGQQWPSPAAILVLLLVGALSYGWSLQLYLRAQRLVGAARTASVFAAAPLVGVAASWALGAPPPGPLFILAGLGILTGVWLHATEHHDHLHEHLAVAHEHPHTHDDGHHHHHHDPMPAGAHTHWHEHEALAHRHEHSEDLHHRHAH